MLKLIVLETKISVFIDLLGLYHVIMPIIIIWLVLQAAKMKQILGPERLPEQKRRGKRKFSWSYTCNKSFTDRACLVKMPKH